VSVAEAAPFDLEALAAAKPGDIALALRDMDFQDIWPRLAQLPAEKAALALHRLEGDFRARVMADYRDAVFLKYLLELLDTDEAADLLADLPEAEAERLLGTLSRADEVEHLLTYPPDTAGGIMDTHLLVLGEQDSVKDAVDYLRRNAAELQQNHDIWVTNPEGILTGAVSLAQLLIATDAMTLDQIAVRDLVTVSPEVDQEHAAHLVERHDLNQLPVVDAEGHLLGQITSEDAITILKRESTEDLQRMSGLSAEVGRSDSTLRMVYSRLPWLAVGMGGSVLGALVIMEFEEALQQAAVLAAFIPLIAATAGSAGIQSSTVTVQGLATGVFVERSHLSRLLREFRVALLNGLAISVLLGAFLLLVSLVATDRLESGWLLFLTLGCSMVGVITLATLIGATMPLLLDRLRIDPAVSTGPFITVSADVVGILFYFVVADLIYL
jgi:magnesium transporter